MKVLVTGSSGHLGEALARTLKDKDISYLGIDLKPGSHTHAVGSITDRDFLQNCFKDIDHVLHTATLHKPHVATHSEQDFIDTNITGTLNLLRAAINAQVKGFIYTSTTSTFGDVLTPDLGSPAIWVTENTIPVPKNIYGVTKNAAESMCQLSYRNEKLPCLVLKTSRFFPEEDDNKILRDGYDDLNLKAIEHLYRRVDIEDVVSAHLCAMSRAEEIGFAKYIISASSPFCEADLQELQVDAPGVVARIYPSYQKLFLNKGWKMLPNIDRVYVNQKARRELSWEPRYDFEHVLDCLRENKDFRSQLSKDVGSKGYHTEVFSEGPYPVNNDT